VVDHRCRSCRYCGYTGVLGWTCDFILITGRSRTVGMTDAEKARPCGKYVPGKRVRQVENIAYSENGRFTFDQQKIRKLYFQGLNDPEIAMKVGCERQTVWRWRQRHNLAPNQPPGRRKRTASGTSSGSG